MADFVDNVIDNTVTVTASANGTAFIRPVAYSNRRVVMLVNVGATPTGTNPTLAFQLQSSLDGTTWYDVGASQSFTDVGNARVEASGAEPQWRVKKTIGGTATPSFTLVTSHLLFTHD